MRPHEGCWLLKAAGRWPWKSEPAKEWITTHLQKQLAPKIDGALVSRLSPAVAGRSATETWERYAATSRRAAARRFFAARGQLGRREAKEEHCTTRTGAPAACLSRVGGADAAAAAAARTPAERCNAPPRTLQSSKFRDVAMRAPLAAGGTGSTARTVPLPPSFPRMPSPLPAAGTSLQPPGEQWTGGDDERLASRAA
ncbi:hypothetical protein HPB48_025178 [Haemaphysalis longicornis]|uniref:Uncharacterized protein n=1 Tax=Haemaphysalis longicornis TaxID=44386 RepID=A0A9J6H8H6_HAELO|nr:hypothetical protein HPB48_025178 [Haemaphysalis longicornis]